MSSRAFAGRAVVVAVLLASPAVPGEAQSTDRDPGVLSPGARVRVTVADEASEETYVGRLAGSDPGSLRLGRGESTSTVIPREAILKLERSVRPGRKTRGALIGFGIGFATFFVWAELASDEGCFSGGNDCGFHAAGSALFALPAAAVGAVVSPGEQWADDSLERLQGSAAPPPVDGLRLRLAPTTDGRGAGLVIAGSF